MFGFKTAEMHAICQKDLCAASTQRLQRSRSFRFATNPIMCFHIRFVLEQKFPVRYKSNNVFSYQIRFTVYTNEHQFDGKFSQIEHKPGAFESGKVCGNFVSKKI